MNSPPLRPLARCIPSGMLALVLAACPVWAEDFADVEYKTDVEYGTGGGEKLLLDVATPKSQNGTLPGLVFIHGGGWSGGDKRDFGELAKRGAKAGYVAITINYRHAPKHVFPAQIEDCKCAVRWLRAKADELKVDPKRIGAAGGSAGGHLVMMLGLMDPSDGLEGEGGHADQSSKVQAVVSYVGPTNLIGEFPPVSQQILKNFLGGTQQEKLDLYRQASPITYVTGGDAPMLLFQGTTDVLVPYDQAFQMTQAMQKVGVPGRVEFLIGEGHAWGGAEMDRTMQSMFAFFDGKLKK